MIVAVPLPGGPQDRASPEAQQAPEDCYIKCSLCGQGLPSWQALREHVDASHPGGAFRCLQCTASFPSRDQLERHEQMHPAVQQVVSTSPLQVILYIILECGTCELMLSFSSFLQSSSRSLLYEHNTFLKRRVLFNVSTSEMVSILFPKLRKVRFVRR